MSIAGSVASFAPSLVRMSQTLRWVGRGIGRGFARAGSAGAFDRQSKAGEAG
jgi:hypothetical protein